MSDNIRTRDKATAPTRLRAAVADANVSQKYIAEQAGFSQTLVSRILNGEVQANGRDHARLLIAANADILGEGVADMLGQVLAQCQDTLYGEEREPGDVTPRRLVTIVHDPYNVERPYAVSGRQLPAIFDEDAADDAAAIQLDRAGNIIPAPGKTIEETLGYINESRADDLTEEVAPGVLKNLRTGLLTQQVG